MRVRIAHPLSIAALDPLGGYPDLFLNSERVKPAIVVQFERAAGDLPTGE
jgi:hypothetical protein